MSKKGRSRNQFLVIVVILVFVGLATGIISLAPQSVIPPQGFTQLSLSFVNITPDSALPGNSQLSGDMLLMSFVSGGLGQAAYGDFSSGDISNRIDGQVSKGFEFSSNLVSQRCEYPFDKKSDLTRFGVLERYNFVEYPNTSIFANVPALEADCMSRGNMVALNKAAFENYYCVYSNIVSGSTAEIVDPFLFFWTEHKLQIDGEGVTTKVITNSSNAQEQSTGADLGNKAYVRWQGNLSTGQNCSSSSDLAAYNRALNDGSQQWTLVRQDDLTNYKASQTNLVAALQTPITINSAQSQVNQTNAQLDTVQNNEQLVIGNNAVAFKSASGKDGAFFYTPSEPYQFPVFSLFVKADSLGFTQPVPIASNVQVAASDVTSGGTTTAQVTWQNTGSSGNFDVTASCDRATVSGVNTGIFVNSGGFGLDSINIQGTTTGSEITANCSATVTPATFGGQPVTSNFSFNISPEQVCDPSVPRICQGNAAYTCNSAGTSLTLVQNCAAQGLVCSAGVCIEDPTTPPGDGGITPPDLGFRIPIISDLLDLIQNNIINAINNIINAIAVVVIILAGFFTLLLLGRYFIRRLLG